MNTRIFAILFLVSMPVFAETEMRTNLEFFNTTYRGRDNTWFYVGNGTADIRFASVGNDNMRAEAAVEFYPLDLSGGSSVTGVPAVSLKRLWIKANFPSWRLTAGKTKVAWGNGIVFNSGDILFGSLSPYLDFTSSTLRDDAAWLTAFNIPTGRFSFIEGVLLPPSLVFDETEETFNVQSIAGTSGGLRYFTRLGGWRFEGGYLYKGDIKTENDLLGHRPYLAFHGHAGVDLYGAVSLAADNGDAWEEVKKTVNYSLGAFHQIRAGYSSTLSLRLETLVLPLQNWSALTYQEVLDGSSGYYGILLYPEITLDVRSVWFAGFRSVISPVDNSAQMTTSLGWHVFQGFTLMGYLVTNIGDEQSLFAWDRSGAWPSSWSDAEFNGISLSLGAEYSY
jgi:hypothetical protein